MGSEFMDIPIAVKDTSTDNRDLIPRCCCATDLYLPVGPTCGGPNRSSQWLAGSIDRLDAHCMRSLYPAQGDRAFDRFHQCGRPTPIRYVRARRIPRLSRVFNGSGLSGVSASSGSRTAFMVNRKAAIPSGCLTIALPTGRCANNIQRFCPLDFSPSRMPAYRFMG